MNAVAIRHLVREALTSSRYAKWWEYVTKAINWYFRDEDKNIWQLKEYATKMIIKRELGRIMDIIDYE